MQEVMNNTSAISEGKKVSNSIGMLVILVSLSMLFATLMMGYIFFRWTSDVWPPMGMQRAELFYPTLSTVAIALSSFSFHYFEALYKKGKEAFQAWPVLVTVALAAVFLISQTKLWAHMNQIGLYVEGGVFPSILHGFTWIHAAHLVVALFLLFYLAFVVMTNPFGKDRTEAIKNIGKVWHFLGVVWLIMYLTIFVL